MKLEFSGAPEIGVARPAVWRRLTDPEFVAASAPGVEAVEAISPTHFRVTSGLGVGAMRVQFSLDVELSDILEPERLRMVSRGRGAGSEVDVVSSVRLDELGSTRTGSPGRPRVPSAACWRIWAAGSSKRPLGD